MIPDRKVKVGVFEESQAEVMRIRELVDLISQSIGNYNRIFGFDLSGPKR